MGHRTMGHQESPKTPQYARNRLITKGKNADLPWRCIALSLTRQSKDGNAWSGTNRHLPASRRPTRARSPMSEPRVIKKYPNRRLYDTVESRYITLADV